MAVRGRSMRWSPFMRKVVPLTYALANGALSVALYLQLVGMRIAEWGQLSLVILGLMFGFVSVLYGRARALQQGGPQTRTLLAADLAFRAVVFYIFAVAISAPIHYTLLEFGYTPQPSTPSGLPKPGLPIALFLPALTLIVLSFGLFYRALRVIAHRHLMFGGVRAFIEALRLGGRRAV
jgi:hypothetical protein